MNAGTRRTVRLALTIAFAGMAGLVRGGDESANPTVQFSRAGAWTVGETANFTCRMQGTEKPVRELAIGCERLRNHLITLWSSDASQPTWGPRCEIVVHPTQAAYNLCLGRPNDASVGSTRLKFDEGRVTVRRIDLRADAADWIDGALPHELTHVIIAEQFQGRSLPRWADEGIAMLSESRAKHRLRLHDLRTTLRERPTYRMHDLMSLRTMPPAHLRDAFYGQSLALTSQLIERSSPAKFLAFLKHSEQAGLDKALQHHFQMNGPHDLQAEWDRWVQQPEKVGIIDLRFPTMLLASDAE